MFDSREIDRVLAVAATTDVSGASHHELRTAARTLEAARRRLDAASSHVLAELEERRATESSHGTSAARWFAREAEISLGAARNRVELAHRLRTELHETDARLTAGRIGWQHVEVIARAANPRIRDQIAEIQGILLDLAKGTVFTRWKREVQAIAERLDADGGYDPASDDDTNELTLTPLFNGITHLDGKLVGDDAQIVRAAIEARADQILRRCQRDQQADPDLPIPRRATLRAKALVELVREALAAGTSTTRAPATELTLVLRDDDPVCPVRTVDGVPLPHAATSAACCNPLLRLMVVDGEGVPLHLGRTARYANDNLRHAASLRDGGCVFPGCDAPASWTDQHHVQHWDDDGLTDIDNLASLCRHHHRLIHRPGWHMEVTPDQWFRWRTPTGRFIDSQRHGRTQIADPPLADLVSARE